MVNSTIVDNIAEAPFFEFAAGGVSSSARSSYQSTIIANNFVGGAPQDLWAQVAFGARVIGANNLIESSNAPLPADTIGLDPMLGPLADNGGRTRTHALLPGSPAIDAGNNGGGFLWDQRGPGFPRVVGPTCGYRGVRKRGVTPVSDRPSGRTPPMTAGPQTRRGA